MESAPASIVEWVENATGGRVVHSERQPRWRPAWYLDVERDGEMLPLYFRGDRGSLDHGVYSLEHEYRVLRVLEAHDIAVPHVYGFCPDPRGIVMERVRGRANLLTVNDDAQRSADWAPPARSTAIFSAVSRTLSSSTHSETRPKRSASSPVMVSQVSR